MPDAEADALARLREVKRLHTEPRSEGVCGAGALSCGLAAVAHPRATLPPFPASRGPRRSVFLQCRQDDRIRAAARTTRTQNNILQAKGSRVRCRSGTFTARVLQAAVQMPASAPRDAMALWRATILLGVAPLVFWSLRGAVVALRASRCVTSAHEKTLFAPVSRAMATIGLPTCFPGPEPSVFMSTRSSKPKVEEQMPARAGCRAGKIK